MRGSVVAWWWVVVVMVVVGCTGAAGAVSCGEVASNLGSCLTYLRGEQVAPAGGCCGGVQRLRGMLSTTADRQFACNCIKQAASRFQDLKDSAVSSLPNVCGSPLPFPVTKSFDCNRVP